ncbi:hypothetical protein LC1Hm_4088 (plasmid) [Halomicrobium sp. LC1Hm]|nr:hypothetical protein LC1Hm_4088 [Halomicrobium sp. LC1Hm]
MGGDWNGCLITTGRTNSTYRDALRAIKERRAEFHQRCRWIVGHQFYKSKD